MNRFFISAFLLLNAIAAFTQDHDHAHEHAKNEFGFSNNVVFNTHENEFAYGIHLHFVRTIRNSDKFGLGLGYERIYDDHKHNSVSLIFMYRPIHHLYINIAPGVVWLDKELNAGKPSLHLETIYEWEFGHFHIGPLLGVALNTNDFHASVGLHLAFGF